MTAEHILDRAYDRPNVIFGSPASRTVENFECEWAGMCLREALVREAALQREKDELARKLSALQDTAANQFAGLGPRERQVMELVLTGLPSKNIAADLRISQRTVKNHRAAIMKKTFAKSIPALARLAIAAAIPCDARIEMGHDRDKETQQQRMPTCEKTDFRFDAAFACGHSVIIECVPNHCGSRSGYLRDW